MIRIQHNSLNAGKAIISEHLSLSVDFSTVDKILNRYLWLIVIFDYCLDASGICIWQVARHIISITLRRSVPRHNLEASPTYKIADDRVDLQIICTV